MESYSASSKNIIDKSLFKQLETEMGAQWLIEKIFDQGEIDYIKNTRKYYGDERIKEEVIKIRWLNKKTLSFLSGIFEIPKEKFLTYRLIHGLNTIK